MTRIIDVPITGRKYNVIIGADIALAEQLQPLNLGQDWILLYDSVFEEIADGQVLREIQQQLGNPRTFAVPSGEGSKSLACYSALAEEILSTRISRDTVVVALGGGVIGDLAGFLAASLLRGLRFVQIPTTLLAQVDSSVGGKVGINATAGKNLIGAFHQPVLVAADLKILQHLPKRDFSAGMAEVLKAALLADADFWCWLENHAEAINNRETAILEEMIARSVQIKADTVLADETERTGRRALLNLGHTFAHALEAATGYDAKKLVHGEAVALGLVMAARLSEDIDTADTTRISALLQKVGLPIATDLDLDPQALYELMLYDKKADQDGLKMVLLERIGQAKVTPAPAQEKILAAIIPSLER